MWTYVLQPDGIAGQVIAREQYSYLKGKTEVINPYRDWVTTVLVEKGTILEGKPVGGRIFVETMDAGTPMLSFGYSISETGDSVGGYPLVPAKQYKVDQPNAYAGKWMVDSSRIKEVFSWTEGRPYIGRGGVQVVGEGIPYVSVSEDGVVYETLPYVGMNVRGLNWLGAVTPEVLGSRTVFATVADVTIEAREPFAQVVSNKEIAVQPAQVNIDFRKPTDTGDPDVEINVTPAAVTITAGVYQKVFYAQPAVVTVDAVMPGVKGEGEDFVLYLRNNDVTLYLGDD